VASIRDKNAYHQKWNHSIEQNQDARKKRKENCSWISHVDVFQPGNFYLIGTGCTENGAETELLNFRRHLWLSLFSFGYFLGKNVFECKIYFD
jgi:hypothetical protein